MYSLYVSWIQMDKWGHLVLLSRRILSQLLTCGVSRVHSITEEGLFLTRLTSLSGSSPLTLCVYGYSCYSHTSGPCAGWSIEEGWTLIYFGQMTPLGEQRFGISIAGLFSSGLESQTVDLSRAGEKGEEEGRSRVQKWEHKREWINKGQEKTGLAKAAF